MSGERAPGVAWIQFPNAIQALKFLSIAYDATDWFEWDNNYCAFEGDIYELDDGVGHVSVRFRASDIGKLRRKVAG